MSKTATEIRELIETMGGRGAYEIIEGTVDSVNEDEYLVDVKLAEDVVLPDVKLRAVSNGGAAGLVCLPTKGSNIVFCQIRGEADYVLLKTSELDKVVIDVAVKLELNAPETVFNGGNNDGLVLLHKLEDNLDKVKQYVTTMNQAIGTALGTIDSTAGSASTPSYQSTMSSQQIVFDDMENKEIKQ